MIVPGDTSRDLALANAVLANEETAIEEFAERLRCVPRIIGAQNAKLGHPLGEHDLADVVQDTVVIILRKLATYDGRGALEGWVFRVCCLELLNAVRRRRRLPQAIDLVGEPRADAAVEREWERMLDRETIDAALERIGGVEAEALRLKHFEGLTFEEMGAQLQLSANTMKTRYYRGLARLEEIVGAKVRKEAM